MPTAISPFRRSLQLAEDRYFFDIVEVASVLDGAYPPTDLGNKDDPVDELVFIVLSTRTREHFYEEAFERVAAAVGDWERLPEFDVEALARAIGSAGLATKKARTLIEATSEIRRREGAVDLQGLHGASTEEAEAYLESLPGVGIKVSKCVAMYTLDRKVFPVDVHCARVMTRLGWIPEVRRQLTSAQQRVIEKAVPPKWRRSLHIRLVQHGRALCRPRDPRCEECPVSRWCGYYAKCISAETVSPD